MVVKLLASENLLINVYPFCYMTTQVACDTSGRLWSLFSNSIPTLLPGSFFTLYLQSSQPPTIFTYWHNRRKRRQCDESRKRDLKILCCWLQRWRKGPRAKECQDPLEARKRSWGRQGNRFFLRSSRTNSVFPRRWFSSMQPLSDFWSPEV